MSEEQPLPKGTLTPNKSHHRDLDDPATVDLIMGEIAQGTKTLAQIARFIGVSSRRLHAWVASHPEIEKRFQMAVATAKADLIAEIRQDLREISTFDIAECINPITGLMHPLMDFPQGARKALKKYKERTKTVGTATIVEREIELYDAVHTRELLWKEAGALREQIDHNINPYQAVKVPVTPRLADPRAAGGPAVPLPAAPVESVDAEFS